MDRIGILLAGFDGVFLEQVKTFLRNTGLQLLSCREPEESLEILRRMKPDMVYLSSKITGGGLQCLRTIKEDADLGQTPVVMVCSNEGEKYLNSCREAGCAHVIRKPLDRRTFLSSVVSFVDMEKRHNARFETRMEVAYGIDSKISFISQSVNLGIGGIFLETEQVFRAGTALLIRFTLPNSVQVTECKAQVAWINYRDAPVKPSLPSGMGLEFLDLSQKNVELLTTYLHDAYITRLLENSMSDELATT